MQAGKAAASTAVDSDSDQEDFEQYSELDAFDTDEIEVAPDDEQALAAFMVRCAPINLPDHVSLQDAAPVMTKHHHMICLLHYSSCTFVVLSTAECAVLNTAWQCWSCFRCT